MELRRSQQQSLPAKKGQSPCRCVVAEPVPRLWADQHDACMRLTDMFEGERE